MATGEVRGATRDQRRGFYWQDWYAAWVMLKALAQPDGVTHIEVEAAGVEAGVDDIIVHRRSGSTFLQLKRKEYDTFSGSDLFAPRKADKPSVIEKLFTGWKALEEKSQPAAVEVRLVTNARASEDRRNQPISPKGFVDQILTPLRAGKALTQDDEDNLRRVRRCAGDPDGADFKRFLSVLHFDFEASNENALQAECARLLREEIRCSPGSGIRDASAFLTWVYDVATESKARPLSLNEIERALRRHLQLPDPSTEHRIALPEHHIERRAVVDEILSQARAILDTSKGGYLRVLGPPGCGKTTLATWIADHHDDEVLVRYHIFDPTRASASTVADRATKLTFVRTLFDVLRSRFPDDVGLRVPTPDTAQEAAEALGPELTRLADSGARLVIIDGIDHVVRAKLDRDGLTNALPEVPPPGVVFVLFGQPDWKYPDWLEQCPSIPVPPFEREETLRHLCAQLAWSQTNPAAAPVRDQLQQKTEGNPLSIFYNIAAIKPLGPDPDRVAAELPNIRLFGPRPHEEYAKLLADVQGHLPPAKGIPRLPQHLLAAFAAAMAPLTRARLQRALPEAQLTDWDVGEILDGLKPVLKESDGRYRIFHDDFRRYAEEQTDAGLRTDAHQRLARALEQDWQDEELSAWVEHLWSGDEYRPLAELPEARKLEEWLSSAPARSVMDLHRYALAASFHLADENLIFRTSLAAERAWEAAGEATGPTLRDWSFEVPPRGHGSDALERRAKVLKAVLAQYSQDPDLALAIADRFALQARRRARPESQLSQRKLYSVRTIVNRCRRVGFPTRVMKARKRRGHLERRPALFVMRNELATQNYLRAHASWLLRSNRLAEAARMARTRDIHGLAVDSWRQAFADETSSVAIEAWAEQLVGRNRDLDFELAGVALVHLAEDRQGVAAALASAFLRFGDEETRRDGYVLLALIGRQADQEPVQGSVRWRISHEPIAWRDFFFHGFSHVMTGKALELSVCAFPADFVPLLNPRGNSQDQVDLGRVLWRLGCAAALAQRELLTPADLATIVNLLVASASFRLAALNSPQIFLPCFALALRDRPPLREVLLARILPELEPEAVDPGPRTFGMLDTLWLLAPNLWRERATALMGRERFPATEPYHRIEWRNHWSVRLAPRGIEPTAQFQRVMALVALGGNRKMDPARLAVDLLRQKPIELVEAQQVQRLVDLLLRLHTDPEGKKQTRWHMPEVLCLALRLDPALFEAEFLRSAVEHDAMEAFGDRPTSIAACWLAAEPTLTLADLLSLWHWVAACPGSFRDEARGPEVGRGVQERLRVLGAPEEADQVARWLSALTPPERPQTEPSTSSELPDWWRIPPIEEVDLSWFNPWLNDRHEVLNRSVAESNSGWHDVCHRLVTKALGGDGRQLELDCAISNWLVEHRASKLGSGALDIAFEHLTQKVRFQTQPSLRNEVSASRRTPGEVFVRLMARGLEVSDAEVIRRTLRGLAALARHPATMSVVEAALQPRLARPDPRVVDMVLLVLRQVPKLAAETVALIQTLSNHPDAWCRWFACSILGREPTWDPPRQVVGQPGPLAPGIKPKEGRLGKVYVHDDSTVRENSIQRICALSDLDEEEVSRWLNTEHRDIEPLPDLPSGWHHTNGVHRSNSRVAEAARRLASRLASLAPPAVLPALLGTVAGYDPWRAICEPENAPPRGWIELGVEEQLQEQASEWVTLRSLGLTHREDFAAIGQDYPRLAHIAAEALFPERPTLFAWVAEPWSETSAPILRRGPVVPLCFRNRTCPFLRAEFGLVPFWDHPAFNDLTFAVDPVPSWNHPDLGKVVIATVSERPARGFGPEALPFQSTVGWYAHPQWLTRFGRPELSLIRFWRRASSRQSTNQQAEVEFGLEVVDLPGWPQS